MIRVILHIGRHKTGTSSLQRYLYENRECLESKHICYPSLFLRGIAHHALSEPFRKQDLKGCSEAEIDAKIDRYAKKIHDVLCRDDVTYVISSEAFQNVDPAIIRRLFDEKVYDVKVVSYFRDQVGYLASAYNQRIHATTYSGTIYDYYLKYFRADYNKFAVKWKSCFSDCFFKIYDRNRLYKENLISDFFNSLFGISISSKKYNVDSNPSLNANFVQLKRNLIK